MWISALDYWREHPEAKPCLRLKRTTTNADRIRSMTDEELAQMLGAFCYVAECRSPNGTPCPFYCVCPYYGSWIDWLKQPVGGNDNG